MQLEYTVTAQNTNWHKHIGNVQVLNIDVILLTRYVGWKLLEASVVQTESEIAGKLEIFKCVRGPHPH